MGGGDSGFGRAKTGSGSGKVLTAGRVALGDSFDDRARVRFPGCRSGDNSLPIAITKCSNAFKFSKTKTARRLVPDRRERRDLYKSTITGDDGHFVLGPIPPGSYKIFATVRLDPGAFFDPDVLRRFDPAAIPVNVGTSGDTTVELKLSSPVR